MKSVKIAGIRLINYIEDSINWKDHKDIVLDFWVNFKCREYGYRPKQFKNMYYVDELPTEVQEVYEDWFESYDFQNEDKDWVKFIDGTLNIFYKTSDPTLLDDSTWFVTLMKSESRARKICEEQLFHGNPNINSFWKIDTNSKSEEVGGRRNGYLFSAELEKVSQRDTRGFYWAVMYQCPDSVKLFYRDGKDSKSKCINWAAECEHMTLLKITPSGRFIIVPVEVEGKAHRDTRMVPDSNVVKKAYTGHSLNEHVKKNFYEMYGRWDEIDAQKKYLRETSNQRLNAMNTMNDEEVNVGDVLDKSIQEFIAVGNVSKDRRDRNKAARQAIKERNQLREREIKKKIREIDKSKNKQDRKDRNRLNPFLSKK